MAKLTLSEIETIAQVETLFEKLKTASESDPVTEIDASPIARIDTAALQCLLIYRRSQQAKGVAVTIDFPSDAFINAAERLGLTEVLAVDHQACGLF